MEVEENNKENRQKNKEIVNNIYYYHVSFILELWQLIILAILVLILFFQLL